MITLTIETPGGATRDISVKPEGSLMEAIRDNGFDDLLAACGGFCSCATCHMHRRDRFIRFGCDVVRRGRPARRVQLPRGKLAPVLSNPVERRVGRSETADRAEGLIVRAAAAGGKSAAAKSLSTGPDAARVPGSYSDLPQWSSWASLAP